MDIAFVSSAAQLGGTVFTVVAFLMYLTKLLNSQTIRDKEAIIASNRQSDSNIKMATALEGLSQKVNVNSNTNTKNTNIIKENVVAVKDNTQAVRKKKKND